MRPLRAACALLLVTVACARATVEGPPKTVLAVFAHPDDEVFVGPLLAHYARQGAKVHLAIVTDGEKGTSPHAGIPAGPELASVRAEVAQEIGKLMARLRPDVVITWGPDGGYGHPDHRLVGDVVTQVVQAGAEGA